MCIRDRPYIESLRPAGDLPAVSYSYMSREPEIEIDYEAVDSIYPSLYNTTAVSYTHLDVYKRQLQATGIGFNAIPITPEALFRAQEGGKADV